jgi:hypothetical protein
MRKFILFVSFFALSVFPHGASLSEGNSNLIMLVKDKNEIVGVHNHNKKIQISRYALGNTIFNEIGIDGKDPLSSERAAVPNGFYIIEFYNAAGNVINILPVEEEREFASHYEDLMPQKLDGNIGRLPITVPNNSSIRIMKILLKLSDTQFNELGTYDLEIVTANNSNQLTDIIRN